MSTTQRIANRLKELREKNGWTQAEVAKRANISVNYYARLERDDAKMSLEIFEKIVRALKVKSSDILPF